MKYWSKKIVRGLYHNPIINTERVLGHPQIFFGNDGLNHHLNFIHGPFNWIHLIYGLFSPFIMYLSAFSFNYGLNMLRRSSWSIIILASYLEDFCYFFSFLFTHFFYSFCFLSRLRNKKSAWPTQPLTRRRWLNWIS